MSSRFDPAAGKAHIWGMRDPAASESDVGPVAVSGDDAGLDTADGRGAGGGTPASLLDVVIYPHRSLGPTGFLVLMAVLCACSFAVGLVFFLSGAWPVVGFLGLDVLIVYLAFRLNYRAARAYETLRLTREALEVTKVDARGRGRRITFQPYWLAVDMDDPPRRHSRLSLRSHGRRLEIGSFLTADEKLDLARTLRHALDEARRAPMAQSD